VLGSVIIGLQGLLVLLAAVVYLVEAVQSKAAAMLNVGMSVLLFAAAGAGLLAVARGVRGRRRWARAPAVTWELVCLPVAYGLVQSGRWYLGLPLALMALLALVAVVASPPAD
jgi:hypothetical protein